MGNLKGKVIQKNGKAYWVSSNPEGVPQTPSNSSQTPENIKIIPMAKLTREERDLLREAHSYIHIDEYYKNKKFLKCYREFHKSTGGRWIDGGFDKFKIACVQARRIWT